MSSKADKDSLPSRPRRYAVRLPATLIYRGTLVTGLTRNLSLGGACVELAEQPPFGELEQWVDQTLTLNVELPLSVGELYCEASVRWASICDLGLRFDGLGPRDQDLLTRLLSRLRHRAKATEPAVRIQ
jgi:hypothetical protein